MQICTLLFLQDNDRILLAMKKRGVGEGKWNGVGGKVGPGELIEAAVVRETQEEIAVTPKEWQKRAEIEFYIPSRNFHNTTHIYLATAWDGQPQETEEMAPQWFALDAIPYESMWSDDRYWLPLVLAGQSIKAYFELDEHDQVRTHHIESLS
jgi:mutator protein MutT